MTLPVPTPPDTDRLRLAPLPFAALALVIYVGWVLALLLLSTPVMAVAGVWGYVAAVVLLDVAWWAIHRRRLADSGKASGWAGAILAMNILLQAAVTAVVYGMIALEVNAAAEQAQGVQGPASTWIGLGLIYLIFGMLFGAPPLEPVWHIGKILSAGVVSMLVVTLLYTLRVALRPRAPG